ncbi:hypothetical protein [Pseudomonas nitroreducens]|nr:hypothetical protein [Pseudomonas nitroreducens]MCE4079620.1 hypothetical protein [Pseudomonas nitroreducens]
MQQNFAQVLLEGGLAVALGAALVATTPQGQEAWAKVAPQLTSSMREDVQKLALYLILLQPGSPVSPTDLRFPIFQPDTLPVVTPSVDPTLWKPGSGGYGADGKVELPSSTGGSDIQQNGGWGTTSPAGEVAGPRNMYSLGDLANEIGADSSKITELPKATRNSPRNIQTDQSASEAIRNLEAEGYKNTPSKDGTVNVLTKDGKTYTFYSNSKTTGLPSAELKINGNTRKDIAVKIRFEKP